MAANDPLEICPLDPVHRILKSRMQFHLVRCKKNHNLSDKMTCPYNSVHIVDKIIFQNHLATCPDYREVQAFMYQSDDKELNGIVTLEQISQTHGKVSVDGEDNWDDDIVRPSYDPMKNSEGKPLTRTLIGASKAKRREFRMRERERMAQLTDPTPTPTQPDEVVEKKKPMTPLRVPRKNHLISEPRPLRLPRNLQTPSTDDDETELVLPKTSLNPVAEEKPNPTSVIQDNKTSEKVKMPKRKPNVNSGEAEQEAKTVLKSNNPQEPQKNVTDSISQLFSNSDIEKKLKELEEITKNTEAEKERLMELLKAASIQENSGSQGLATKKIGRCAANFA